MCGYLPGIEMTDQSLSSPQLPIALLLQAAEAQLPPAVAGWVDRQPVTVVPVTSIDELMVYALRSRPRFIIIDGRTPAGNPLAACRKIKRDPFTGVVPVMYVAPDGMPARVEALDALAD